MQPAYIAILRRIERLLIFLCLLAACSSPAPILPESTSQAVPTIEPVATPTISITSPPANPTWLPSLSSPTTESLAAIPPTSSPAPTATSLPAKQLPDPPPVRTHYALDASLDYANHSLAVSQIITYTNKTTETLNALPLVIEPLSYSASAAAAEPAFDLHGLAWVGGDRITSYQQRENYLNLVLPQPLPPGQALTVAISYTLQLPATSRLPNLRPYPFGYTDLQANLGDWYPFVPIHLPGKGWLIHPPHTYGEHLAHDIADFDVTLRLADSDPNLVIAASVPPEPEPGALHYRLPAARAFAWSASPYYEVITRTVELPGSRPVTVSSYFFPFYENAGQRTADTAVQALQVYSRLFGTYPLPSLSVVQADFLDGMEYPGLFFLGKDFYNWYNDSEQSFLTALTAHETAHQWWYAVVGNDPAQEPWLDEALSTYSEVLFYENTYPEALPWWWEYRVAYYKPYGRIDITIYDVQNAPGFYRPYRDAVYLNGANFFAALRQLVGDPAFFAALDAYVAQSGYGQASAQDFFAAVRSQTSADLAPLLAEYFRR